jgi:hypothetical protein
VLFPDARFDIPFLLHECYYLANWLESKVERAFYMLPNASFRVTLELSGLSQLMDFCSA